MPNRTVHFLTSALVGAAIIGTPFAAEAGGVSHMGTYGGGMTPCPASVHLCPGRSSRPPAHGQQQYPHLQTDHDDQEYRCHKHIHSNIISKQRSTITKNIDIKNIVTKTIDNSKNININKSIVINKGGDNISVSAQASAVASASHRPTPLPRAAQAQTRW